MLKKALVTIAKYADDLLYLCGCGLILVGVYQVMPVLTWFSAGVMCLVTAWLVARGAGGAA